MEIFAKTLESLKKYLTLNPVSNIKPNYQIVALLDISKLDTSGNAFVITCDGTYTDSHTTKQLMNQMVKSDGTGFEVSKQCFAKFQMRNCLPYVNGCVAYLPMSGGSRNSCDWIGIHCIQSYEIFGKEIHFFTNQGDKVILNLLRGELENRLHDLDVVMRSHLMFLEAMSKPRLIQLRYCENEIMKIFKNCTCPKHMKIKEMTNPYLLNQEQLGFILCNIGIEGLVKEEIIKHYLWSYQRIKKLF